TLSETGTRINTLLSESGPGIRRVISQADSATRDLSQSLRENRLGIRMFIDSGGRAIAETRVALGRATMLASRLDSVLADGMKEGTLLYRLMKDRSFAGE